MLVKWEFTRSCIIFDKPECEFQLIWHLPEISLHKINLKAYKMLQLVLG